MSLQHVVMLSNLVSSIINSSFICLFFSSLFFSVYCTHLLFVCLVA